MRQRMNALFIIIEAYCGIIIDLAISGNEINNRSNNRLIG
jgi:hypothetical protein